MTSLGSFGILASANARIYLDAIDALDREIPSRGDSLDRSEALEIIDRVVAGESYHPEEMEEETEEGNPAHPSSIILRRLIAAKWLEEERHSDYRRTIYLEPGAQTLLEAFRTMVSQSIASFTGKLRLVCDRLSALRYPHSRTELIWEDLKSCLDQTRAGLRELRLIRKQVERYAQRQLKTVTIAQALDIIYNEFSQLITQQCYRELIHARLPERLREAMEGLTALEQDDLSLQKLRDDFIRTEQDASRAAPEILRTIEELSLALGDVEPTADRVDASTADFARRSRSRIRYIQDVGSARRQQIKTIFDYVRDHLSEVRLADLEEKLALPQVRLTDTGLVGMNSLARRRDSGFANSAVIDFLRALPRKTPLWHFGDSDPKGFDILRDLRERVGKEITSLRMDYRPSEKNVPLSSEDWRTIARLNNSAHLTDHEKLQLTRMVESSSKGMFEQESLGQPRAAWQFYG